MEPKITMSRLPDYSQMVVSTEKKNANQRIEDWILETHLTCTQAKRRVHFQSDI